MLKTRVASGRWLAAGSRQVGFEIPRNHSRRDGFPKRLHVVAGQALLGMLLANVMMILLSGATAQAENWPGWRGPRGDGTSLEENVPTHWDAKTGKNIVWSVDVPGEGHASPIVWNDTIFQTTCLTETQERVLLCLDRKTGQTRWRRTVVKSPMETKHKLNSYASGTPVTDGKLVYVAFLETDGSTVPARNVSRVRQITSGKITIAAYDFDGNQKWIVRAGAFASAHGFCSCPVLFEDLVIINGDHDGDSYIVALKKATGEQVWIVPRKHKTRSYVTPLIREIDGRAQMVFSGSRHIISLDPRTGSRHWTIDGPTEQFVASMVSDGNHFYMVAGFPTYHVMAIRPDGRDDVTKTHVAWHKKTAKCYVPSPVVVGDYLLVADDRGTANCFATANGKRLWQGRLGRHFSASLVTAGGLAYFLADDGVMKVIRPGSELNIVAENDLGEVCQASPALSQGKIYLRSEKHLFCIGSSSTASD